MPILPRHDHDDGPPSPAEYLLLLLLLIGVAAGYIFWWRKRGGNSSFALGDLRGLRPGVRLSTEDDGPTMESFLTDNASSESLPLHLEQEVPFLPESAAAETAALADNLNESRFPRTELNPVSHHVATSPTSSPTRGFKSPELHRDSGRSSSELNPASHHNVTSASGSGSGYNGKGPAVARPLSTIADLHPAHTHSASSTSDPLGAGVEMTTAVPKYVRRSARAPKGPIELSDSSDDDGNDSDTADRNRIFKLDDDDDD